MSIEKPKRLYADVITLSHNYHRILSNTIDGKLNNVKTTTLNTSTSSSTISNTLCTVNSHISLVPESSAAAVALSGHFIKSKTTGYFIVSHASTGTTSSYTITYTITA